MGGGVIGCSGHDIREGKIFSLLLCDGDEERLSVSVSAHDG